MAPVANRLTISLDRLDLLDRDGRAVAALAALNRPRSVISRSDCSSTAAVYCLKMS